MPTPYWKSDDDRAALYHGDSLALLPLMESGSVDAVVTDPPYGVDFKGKNTKHTARNDDRYADGVDDASIGPAVVRLCVERFGRVVVTAPAQNLFDYPRPVEVGSVYCPSGAGLGRWGFILTHPILYYGKCPYLANGMGHRPNSFRSFATQEPNGHPCPKPVEWMVWLVRKASFEGDTILDPFTGSGTTGVAAIQIGRKFIGIELSEKYCEIAARRLAAACCEDGGLFDPKTRAKDQPRLFSEAP